jgi:hypothetical protein
MSKPQRLRRSRRAGANLAAQSRTLNGRGYQYVGQPTHWANPHDWQQLGRPEAVWRYRKEELPARLAADADFLEPLRGLNLACWCPLDEECHADVLLEYANH